MCVCRVSRLARGCGGSAPECASGLGGAERAKRDIGMQGAVGQSAYPGVSQVPPFGWPARRANLATFP